jgi:bifunctional DNA-binding transcriptional regulator/antitoxin component of YhaV-PrlF toxin-antitoxin module
MEGWVARGTVSSKYQVVIPKEIREKLDIKVGQEVPDPPLRGAY